MILPSENDSDSEAFQEITGLDGIKEITGVDGMSINCHNQTAPLATVK